MYSCHYTKATGHLHAFTPEAKDAGTHSLGFWVGHRASMNDVKRRKFLYLQGLEYRPSSSKTEPSPYEVIFTGVPRIVGVQIDHTDGARFTKFIFLLY